MKAKRNFLMILMSVLFCTNSFGQDTLITANDYKYKLGAKLISEQSWDQDGRGFADDKNVYYGGLVVIRKIKESICSFETGIYFSSKVKAYAAEFFQPSIYPYSSFQPYVVNYHYLSIPINFRVDTKSVYLSGGCFFDYLLFHRTEQEYFIDSTRNYGTDRKLNFGYNFILGIEKSFSRHMSVFAEARAMCTVSSPKTDGGFLLNHETLAPTNLNFGFGFGVNYKLLRKLSRKTV